MEAMDDEKSDEENIHLDDANAPMKAMDDGKNVKKILIQMTLILAVTGKLWK